MANKAVFIDRDNTLIDDPGYISDPQAVRLLPGVDLALRSLTQSGYKIVVVTNQSGVARGLLTKKALENIHEELQRQLAGKKIHLDGIYYCPYHPDGTVKKYAKESDLRKPAPGMLLQAAGELDIDLEASWMVGDSSRDIQAGRNAGCRTVRVAPARRSDAAGDAEDDAEKVEADFSARNLVEAARVILRVDAGVDVDAAQPPPADWRESRHAPGRPRRDDDPPPGEQDDYGSVSAVAEDMSEIEVQREILRELRAQTRQGGKEDFTITKMVAGIVQMLALLTLGIVFYQMWRAEPQIEHATVWGIIAVTLQVMALTFFEMQRQR